MKAMMVLSVAIALSVGSTPRAIAGDPPRLKQYSAHFGCYDPGGKTIRTTGKIKGTRKYAEHEEQQIYQDVRVDTDGYVLKVPNGTYRLSLKFCEIQRNAIGQRIFDVKVQGQQVADRLDIFAKVGKNTAYELRSPDVKVTNGLLKIDFVHVVGSPCIAAIMVGGDIDGAQNAIQRSFGQQINCGGPGWSGYEPDFGF